MRQFILTVATYGFVLTKKDTVQFAETVFGNKPYCYYLINQQPAFFLFEQNLLVPHLFLIHQGRMQLPLVVVDLGAVPFVLNGADIMRPGIVSTDFFTRNALVAIAAIPQNVSAEKTGTTKAIAVGKALVSSEELTTFEKGRCIQTLHYVGDAFWNVSH